ncbi:AraC family transcriptional regulator [Leptotrichia sp. OH3620_COT-345]|uniref:helix-turn-helix transcriptional regulator n=1 Tax=Leptotrichia sp. OH3620_COT-345 TaxID=2491048 RepID=UPI000F64B5F6|nr:helix-turn-helix transcriptional regulator [Leptotrichia sp. OH3620_COT-345]RRD38074.1 AraC family transcriptional regulator [Leptotrichia sp. OH3620_COT-345]
MKNREKIENEYENENFAGIFNGHELKKAFEIKEIKKEFGKKYSLVSKEENLKCALERYELDEDYEVYLLKASGKMKQDFFYPKVKSNIFEIVYCLEGECFISSTQSKKNYYLKKGDILIYKLNNNDIDKYRFKSSDLKKILIFLNMDNLESNLSKSMDKKSFLKWKEKVLNIFENDIFCYGKSNSEVNILSNQIENMLINDVNDYLEFKMKIFHFLFLILKIRVNSMETILIDDIQIVKEMKEMLNEYSISEIPTIKELYESLKVSNYQLQRAFKKIEGVTIYQYIQKKKMEYSKFLLETTDKNILDIAIEVGYENPSKFSKTFKKYFGILPSKYQRKC